MKYNILTPTEKNNICTEFQQLFAHASPQKIEIVLSRLNPFMTKSYGSYQLAASDFNVLEKLL